MKSFSFGQFVLAAVLASTRAWSQAGAARTGAPHVVEIHVDGKPAYVAQTRTVATEILLRISVVPVVLADDAAGPSYPTPGEPFIRAYFDFRTPAPRLVIVDGRTQSELERRTLPEGASLETSVEAASHVLYMVVDSLLEEAPVEKPARKSESSSSSGAPAEPSPKPEAPSRASAAPPVREPEPKRDPEPEPERAGEPEPEPVTEIAKAPRREHAGTFGLEAGVAFRTLYLGQSRLQPGGGLALDLRNDATSPRFSVVGMVSAHAPVELGVDAGSVSLLPWTIALVPSFQSELASHVDALVGASASLTWFSLNVGERRGARPASSAGGVDVALGAAVGVRVRTSNRLAITLSGTLDLDLKPRTFLADVDGERRVLAELPRLRPMVSLSATYSLLGPNGVSRVAEVD